jgi:hypothetical protein
MTDHAAPTATATATESERAGLTTGLYLTDAEVNLIAPGRNRFAGDRWATPANPEGAIVLYFETDPDETDERGRLVAYSLDDCIYPR